MDRDTDDEQAELERAFIKDYELAKAIVQPLVLQKLTVHAALTGLATACGFITKRCGYSSSAALKLIAERLAFIETHVVLTDDAVLVKTHARKTED